MDKVYRIGVLGLVHDHGWGHLDELAATGAGELVAAADPNEPLLARVKEAHGCATYTSHEQMLDNERLDAVFIFADNRAGAELAVEAARRGLHIMLEKPMASTLDGAARALVAARQASVRFMVNWPFAWWPQMQHALTMAAGGELGDLWQVKYRAAHNGPKEMGCSPWFYGWLLDPARNGGGAMMDYCGYGAMLARVLLGPASHVTAVAARLCKQDITAEDNGVVVTSHAHGIGIAEGSWTQIGKLTSYITAIYGTRATLMIEPRQAGRLFMATADRPEGFEVQVPPPPGALANGTAHFLGALASGEPFHPLCRAQAARDVQAMLAAAFVAAQGGQRVALPLDV